MKKIFSLFIALVFVITAFPLWTITTFAESTAVVTVESASAFAGKTVDVNVNIKDNPGILAASLAFTFSEGLTLVGAKNGEAFQTLTMTKPGKFVSPCKFVWDGSEISDDDIKDGTILTLTFMVGEDVEAGTDLIVNVSCNKGDVIDGDMNVVSATTIGGVVSIIDYTPGDLNNDGTVSPLDLVFMRRYLAGGYDIEVVEDAADVNGDGTINVSDLVLIRRYLAGGYDVELNPSQKKCDHTLVEIAAKDATCTENGNIACWYCAKCGNYYTDAEAANKVISDSVYIEATGHTPVIDPAVEPTYESVGYTEGSHCSVCKEILVAQTVIPQLKKDEYSIKYYIANNDKYLAGINIENPNPTGYTSEDGVRLLNLNVEGYIFDGWYDGAGANGELVKTIPAGTKGNIELYAKWTLVEYTVKFESELIPVSDAIYTVDKGTVLPSPSLDGYIFAGWSDDDGNIVKKINIGTTGHKTYMANWLSERNQAWTKTKLDAPIVYEDDNIILFTYEIGEIRNVPLYVIHDFGKINSNGVEKTVTKTYTTTVSESEMKTYTETVSKATTDSFGWTLSNEWTNSVSVSEDWCKENGLTTSEAHTVCTTDSGNWYVSSGKYGSSTSETIASNDLHNLFSFTANAKANEGNTSTAGAEGSAELNADSKWTWGLGLVPSLGASLGLTDLFGINAGIETNANIGNELSLGGVLKGLLNLEVQKTTGTEAGLGFNFQGEAVSTTGHTKTNTGGWNQESGYGGSSSVSNSSTISKEISEKITERYGYGESYVESSGQSSTQGFTASEANTNEYGSAVTYSTEKTEEITSTYTTSNTMSGYHRWIMAGTAHVFAIVGYDIANKSYFVTNFTVMDDEMHEFEDYSYQYSSYDDNQNSVIPFEVPAEIEDYVSDRVCESKGLEVSKDGVITGYTGEDDIVIIPEYKVITNLDGTNTAIKVTAISETAFQGNEKIKAIIMSDFITEVPNNAFKGCISLQSFDASGLTKIGDNAFAGCTSMKFAVIGENITHLGDHAFDGLDGVGVKAANSSIIQKSLNSGAKEIVIAVSDKCTDLMNMTLKVSNTTESFTINGFGKEFTNVYIESDAAKTAIHRAVFVSTSTAPIRLSSQEVVLQEVSVTAPTLGLILLADNTNIALYGESYITTSDINAMLSKNISFSKLNNDFYSHFNVSGNLLICGKVENDSYLTVTNGSVTPIDEDLFDKYANGIAKVTFNANGGTTTAAYKTVAYGGLYGALPIPTRANYTFVGWFTQATGGTQVLPESVVTSYEDHTLYAHWSANTFTVNFNSNGGTVTTTSKKVIYGNSYGTLPAPVRNGFKFLGWYNASGVKVTESTVQSSATDVTLTARWTPLGYSVSWTDGTGYTIKVERTSSPYAGASIGNLANGATIFYGDVLKITYTPAANYKITNHGPTSVTVVDHVTSAGIHCSAERDRIFVDDEDGVTGGSVRYHLEVYTSGNNLVLTGWLYDEENTAAQLSIDTNSVHRGKTNVKGVGCTCGRGDACKHGFTFVYGPYTGSQRFILNTWKASGGSPIGLWDSFHDDELYLVTRGWVNFPSTIVE